MDAAVATVCREVASEYYGAISDDATNAHGEVSELYESEISLKTEEGYRRIAVEDILQIQLVEGAE